MISMASNVVGDNSLPIEFRCYDNLRDRGVTSGLGQLLPNPSPAEQVCLSSKTNPNGPSEGERRG